jgi:hypothetical protein
MPGEDPRRAGQGRLRRPRGFAEPAQQCRGGTPCRASAVRRRSAASSPVRHALPIRTPLGARPRPARGSNSSGLPVSTVEVIQLAMFAGVMGAALLISAIALIRERAAPRGECRAAQPCRRPQCLAAALRGAAQPARPAHPRMGERPNQKPELARRCRSRQRRPGRSCRLPRLRPLADAALGRRARTCASLALRDKGARLRPDGRDPRPACRSRCRAARAPRM